MTLNKNQAHEAKSDFGESVGDSFDSRRAGMSEPIVWSEDLLVGVEIIDTEHRALIGLFNSILVVSKSHNQAELATLLEQLGNITASHFESEETLMKQFDYAHAAQHRIDHQKLLDEYGHQVDDWRNKHISAELLCRFMYRWLLRHVIASDMPLGEAIKHKISRFSDRAPVP